MPLILALREGEDFYVEDERIKVEKIESENHFIVLLESTGECFDVVDDQATEVLPDVLVSAGNRGQADATDQRALARVAIDAPRDKHILRGEHYRAAKRKQE